MTERPILFSSSMVRAILEGRKTQTRRVITPQPDNIHSGEPYWNVGGYRAYAYRRITDPLRMGTHNTLRCPYGQSGDLLWLRETWAFIDCWDERTQSMREESQRLRFRADMPAATSPDSADSSSRWSPSIHMPRWASRITLAITDVRVERVQDITEEDAIAEGCSSTALGSGQFTAKCDFIMLWESINHKRGYGWHVNPWVWVISFERCIAEEVAAA